MVLKCTLSWPLKNVSHINYMVFSFLLMEWEVGRARESRTFKKKIKTTQKTLTQEQKQRYVSNYLTAKSIQFQSLYTFCGEKVFFFFSFALPFPRLLTWNSHICVPATQYPNCVCFIRHIYRFKLNV